MSELHCNDYITKMDEIKTASIDDTTTKLNMETLHLELKTIESLIDSDIGTEDFPTTFTHLNKFNKVNELVFTEHLLEELS